jgi:peptidoglycan-associated lipoprotein
MEEGDGSTLGSEQPISVRTEPIELAPRAGFDNMDEDHQIFSAYTVYFDFDRSAVPPGERSKIEPVADYLRNNRAHKLSVEGHCDERGTEEYNRSLGERRALALREYLVNLGISADRIRTITYGEDRPADPGHDDSAWSKNRRGEFVLLKPR